MNAMTAYRLHASTVLIGTTTLFLMALAFLVGIL